MSGESGKNSILKYACSAAHPVGGVMLGQPDPLNVLLFGLAGCLVGIIWLWVIWPGEPTARAFWKRIERRLIDDVGREKNKGND
jgi:hypothetical protein